jgi:cell division protein FtsQ
MSENMKTKLNTDPEKPEQAPRRNKKVRSRMMVILYIAIMVAIAVTSVLLVIFLFFKVSVIKVVGSTIYSDEEIIDNSGISIGSNMLFINGNNVSNSLYNNLPYVESSEIIKRWPATIEIDVHDASPKYSVEKDGKYVYVSEGKKILENSDTALSGSIVVTGAKTGEANLLISFEDVTTGNAFNDIADTISSKKITGLTKIDLTNAYDIKIIYDNRITLLMGGPTDLAYKLNFGVHIIEGSMTDTDAGTLNLSLARKDNKAYFTSEVESDTTSQEESTPSDSSESSAESGDSASSETSTESESSSNTSLASRGSDIPDTPYKG